VLARRRRGLDEDEQGELPAPMELLREGEIGTMAEGVGRRS
jgi:hypothetical protein